MANVMDVFCCFCTLNFSEPFACTATKNANILFDHTVTPKVVLSQINLDHAPFCIMSEQSVVQPVLWKYTLVLLFSRVSAAE